MKRDISIWFVIIVLFLPLCARADIIYKVIDLGTLGDDIDPEAGFGAKQPPSGLGG